MVVQNSSAASLIAGLSSAPSPAAHSTNAFASQLAATLESYLNRGNTSHLEIDIDTVPSQNSGTRQFTVTVKTPDAPTSSPAASPSTSGTANTNAAAPAAPPITNEVDAYWAMQPAAVQQLRYMSDPEQTWELANQLAGEGYTIDRPIMVNGWDPYQTMLTRQVCGFTWVPAINQPSVPLPPGFTMPGIPSYDPNSPPPGSIKVSTDFAKPFLSQS